MKTSNKKKTPAKTGHAISRRRFLKTAGALTALTASGPLSAEVLAPKPIRVASFGPSHCASPFVLAKLNDEFKKANLNVDLINYPTMPKIAKDLMTGKIDYGQLIVPLVFAIHTGAGSFKNKAVPMAITQITGINGSVMLVRKGSGIKEHTDLRNKVMSSHSKLSIQYLLAQFFLERNDRRVGKDLHFTIVDLDDAIPAMARGEMDVFVMPEPKGAVAEAKNIGTIHLLGSSLWKDHPCCALTTRWEHLKQNKGQVEDITRCITKTGLEAHRPDMRESIIDTLQSSKDFKYDKLPKKALMRAFQPGRADFYPFPYQSSGQLIANLMQKYGVLPNVMDAKTLVAQVFRSGMSRKIMKELGANPPKKIFRPEHFYGKVWTFSE